MKRITTSEVAALLAAAPAGATVHLVGAGGCGMSGLGHLLLDLGFGVSGSDLADGEEVRQLRGRGARVYEGHAGRIVEEHRPVLAVYTSAVRLDNPELVAAERLEIPIVRRAVLLAALLHQQRGICVAGMHGKTTTASLLSFALKQLNAQPSYAVGALVPQLGRHATFSLNGLAVNSAAGVRNGFAVEDREQTPYFVIEADESDGTLREFHPEHAIILNVDEEHLDYFANLDAICEEFNRFAGQTRGFVAYCADDPRLVSMFAQRPNSVSFGFNPLATYRIESRQATGTYSNAFELWRGEERLGEFNLSLVGEKNVSNAAGAAALLHTLGHPMEDIAKALAPFKGAARRQQELHRDEQVRVFDDYGHHPEEIETTLRALKGLARGRMLVAFQPHRYTRTQHLLGKFATAFKRADCLWINEIYAASETPIPGVDGKMLADTVRQTGQVVEFAPTLGDLKKQIKAVLRPGDLVLFLGAGDITKAAHEFAAELKMGMSGFESSALDELVTKLSPETLCRRDEPLAKRTTLRVGGKADLFVEPKDEAELAEIVRFCQARKMPYFLLGRGSNLLIRDGGIRGVVISLAHEHFSRIEIAGLRLTCGAGARLKNVAQEAKRRGIAGMEFMEGIPGNIGGGLRMNAGAMQSEMFAVVESVRFMDCAGNVHERPASEVPVEYRHCALFDENIALGVVLCGKADEPAAVDARMQAYSQKRWASQPAKPSAGCIFKNPTVIPAGKLVDELGLKGTRVGGAVVSAEHGNFIVNDGTATAKDVLALIEIIKQKVRQARGIEMRTEVQIIGED
ncbi:MAG: murC [Verrucomicrobia bacterium]|nr:murC [Verrucomicrobiota bacterium]